MYKQVDEARAKRLSAKLQANASDNKKMSEIGKDDEMVEEGVPGMQSIHSGTLGLLILPMPEEMQVDGEKDEKKVSTSGPRQAGRRQWKEKKGISEYLGIPYTHQILR